MNEKKREIQASDRPADDRKSVAQKGLEENQSAFKRFRNFFKLENIFKSNKAVFVFSLVIALILWIGFVALDSSQEVTMTINNVPIMTTLGKGAEDMGLRIFGAENLSADVIVSGRQYDLQKITANDIQLTAQPSPVTGAGIYTTPISKGSTSNVSFSIVSVEPKEINVIVDRYIEGRSFDVAVEHDTIGAPEGYILDAAHPSADTVTISGPETEINRISRVAARANQVVETLTKTTYFESTYIFYDSADKVLITEPIPEVESAAAATDSMQFKMKPRDLTISVEPASMQVIVPVYEKKTLEVTVNMLNAPEDTSGIVCKIEPSDQLKVRIPTDGDVQVLDQIQLNVDFSTIMNSTTRIEFPIDQLQIPAGYKLEDDISSFTVQVTLEGKDSILLNVENIQFSDEMMSQEFIIVSKRIENVRVVGDESVITGFDGGAIVAIVDTPTEEVTANQIEVPVRFEFAGHKSCWIYNREQAGYTVTLQKIAQG